MSSPFPAPDPESRELLRRLGDCSLPQLSHENHVRTAWCLLRESGLIGALARYPELLRTFATSKGAPQIYHETITFAFVCLIHERMAAAPGRPWRDFAAAHPELFEKDFLGRYYPADLLASERARRTFVWPPPPHPASLDESL